MTGPDEQDEREPFVGESDGQTVMAERGDPEPLDNRADDANAELERLRDRAKALGIDYARMPLGELRAAVEAGEDTAGAP